MPDVNLDQAAKVDEKKPKRTKYMHHVEQLINDPNGIKSLFQTFALNKETVESLKQRYDGSAQDSTISDLNKVMNHVKSWHLNYFPKESFEYFGERLRNFGTKHKDRKDLHAYLARLRRHHTGDEIMNEFVIDINKDVNMAEEKDPLAPLNDAMDPMAGGFDEADVVDNAAVRAKKLIDEEEDD